MAQLCLDHHIMKVTGQVSYLNAEQCFKDGLQLLRKINSSEVLVDLSQLEQANTLVLAIFIQWTRQLPDKQLKLTQVPEKMVGILRASHLESLQVI